MYHSLYTTPYITIYMSREDVKLALMGMASKYSTLTCGVCLCEALSRSPVDTGVLGRCYSKPAGTKVPPDGCQYGNRQHPMMGGRRP